MKNKFTILGCGSSLGAPWITNYMGKLKKKALNKYLSNKYSSNEQTGYTCEYCNMYTTQTKKSLSAHVRACKKQHEITVDTDV